MTPRKTYRFIRRYRHFEPGAIITPPANVAELYLSVKPPVMQEIFDEPAAPLVKKTRRRRRRKAADDKQV